MINLAKLGTSYTLHQATTNETSIIHVVLFDDIKDKIGMPSFVSVNQYQRVHNASLKKTNPLTRSYYNVSWHVSSEEDFDLSAVVTKCKQEKNDIVIVEIIRD